MIFLLHYDRTDSNLIMIKEYEDDQRSMASEARLELEISLIGSDGIHEVVLLEADSQEHLRMTHARYFETYEQLRNKEKRGQRDDGA